MGIVAAAQLLADDVLFPAALRTDASAAVPVQMLDRLADAGLYGLSGPASSGGLDADFETACAVVEALASGCLTTTFVWAQHIGVVRAAAASDNESIGEWLAPFCSGARRAGLALAGALPGPAQLVAREAADGWILDGSSPFVSGWGRVDVIHTAARTADRGLVWALVDARESDTLSVKRLGLAALNATATVRASFRAHPVPARRITSVTEYTEQPTPPQVLRVHAAFALGVASRCCRLLGPTPLDADLARLRLELDRLDPATIEAARGAAGGLALRAAAAVAVTNGSRSLLLADQVQRLLREAFFVLIYALRAGSRETLVATLTTSQPGPPARSGPGGSAL